MISIKAAMQHAANVLGVPVEDLKRGPLGSRSMSRVRARHAAMWTCQQLTNASYPELRRAFGMQNHTSVLHGCRRAEGFLTDAEKRQLRMVVESETPCVETCPTCGARRAA